MELRRACQEIWIENRAKWMQGAFEWVLAVGAVSALLLWVAVIEA